MSQWISGIASGAPLWVWPLLVLLIFIGLRATRERTTSVYAYYVLPLLGIMSLNTLTDQPNLTVAWPSFTTAYLIGAAMAFRWQSYWLIQGDGSRVQLSGEWVTLVTLMIIFLSNFFNGFALQVFPEIHATALFTGLFSAAIGWASGTFLGRVLFILRS